jgi:hypothetical protein
MIKRGKFVLCLFNFEKSYSIVTRLSVLLCRERLIVQTNLQSDWSLAEIAYLPEEQKKTLQNSKINCSVRFGVLTVLNIKIALF